nr:MAG TPA: hypothetical protein [Bacteriophage sp.]
MEGIASYEDVINYLKEDMFIEDELKEILVGKYKDNETIQ